MHLAHRAQLALGELAVLDAKAGVLVGQWVALGVLLPQQHQRDAGALEFSVHDGEIRGQLVAGAGHCRAIQPGLEFLVGEALRGIPVDAGSACHGHVFTGRALGNLQRSADLAVAQPGLHVQAQCLLGFGAS
jgi:hypothetical protein